MSQQSKLKNLKSFLNNSPGSNWHKVNLHVHASGQDPDAIVDAAINSDISLIAITDHNTFRFVKTVQEAAARRTDTDLVVLPGIEITLSEGAHIIAVFDPDFNETAQTLLLGNLKLPAEATDRNAVRDRTCSDVLTDITDAKGITVVPHPYSDNIGFLDSARKVTTKLDWLESGNIGLIQIAEDKVKYVDFDSDGKWQNRYVLSTATPSQVQMSDYCLAPVAPGEAKTPTDIEKGAVWLKLGSRTVRGLRQVTCEPRTCISRNTPDCAKTFKLLGLTVEGGFFDGLSVGFSPDLTCIIGENHSGKTAIFDFISFALGRDKSVLSLSDREEERDLLLRRLDAILQPDGTVNLYLARYGRYYCVSRVLVPEYDIKTSKIISVQTESEAMEYDSANDQLIPVDFGEIPTLPEIYTQGHVGVLRKSVISQLSLIDDLAGLTKQRKEKQELIKQLGTNAKELAELQEEKERLAGIVGRLTILKQSLKSDKKHLEATDNDKWQASALLFSSLNRRIAALEELIEEDEIESFEKTWKLDRLEYDDEKFALPDLLKIVSDSVDEYNDSIDSIITELKKSASAIKTNCQPSLEKWDEEFSKHKRLVSTELRKKGFDSPEQLLNRIETLQGQIDTIEKEDQPQLTETVNKIKTLTSARKTLLSNFNAISEKIWQSRESKIEELNKAVGPDIVVSLEEPSEESYIALLTQIYTQISSKKRKIQNRDEQLNLLAMFIKPAQLIEAVQNDGTFTEEDGSETTLVNACGITQNTQEVLCTIKDFPLSLNRLQVFTPEPAPKIMVRREGTGKLANLRTELSPGEQSSTILALALMAREEPLIIDQPEDELGYSYIVNKIVSKILDSKTERQVIFISHNANIPVLADAEYVMKVRNDPVESQSKCTIEEAGTFAQESICNKLLDLEGGERAFQVRQYRYAIPRRARIY